MHSHPVRQALTLTAAVLMLLAGCVAASCKAGAEEVTRADFYAVQELGRPEGFASAEPVALNDGGRILCQAAATNNVTRAVLWVASEWQVLPTLSAGNNIPYGLNDHDDAVGVDVSPTGERLPVLWHEGSAVALPVPQGYAGGEARDINNDGTVAGDLIDSTGAHHACVWHDGQPSLLPMPDGFSFSRAVAINSFSHVAGAVSATSDASGLGESRAALWRDGQVVDLGVSPGYSYSYATALNDAGAVVGQSAEPPNFGAAFHWLDGELTKLGPVGANPRSINDNGTIVGTGLDYVGRGSYVRKAVAWFGPRHLWLPLEASLAGYYSVERAAGVDGSGRVAASRYGNVLLLTPAHADVSVSLVADKATPSVGETVTLTLTLVNRSPDTGFGLQVAFSALPGLEYKAISTDPVLRYANVGNDYAYAELGEFPGGSALTITVPACVTAGGQLTVPVRVTLRNDRDDSDNRPQLVLNVPDPPMADLVPRWSWVDVVKPRNRPQSEWKFRGSFTVSNRGTAESPRARVNIYLVAPEPPYRRHKLLQRVTIEPLAPGRASYPNFHAKLPMAVRPNRGRILAVVDEFNQIPESRENNNTVLSNDLREDEK